MDKDITLEGDLYKWILPRSLVYLDDARRVLVELPVFY